MLTIELTSAPYNLTDYNIMEKISEMTSIRDDQTMTQYAWGNTGMISYDDERAICDKTEYAQVHDLNGYIIWEISGDLMPDLSTPLLDAANAKLLEPSLDCASLDLSTIGAVMSELHPSSQAAGNSESELVFYPDHGSGICRHDAQQSEWLKKSETSNNLQTCCNNNFSWNEAKCLDESPESPPPPAPKPLPSTPAAVNSEKVDSHSNGNKPLYYPSSMEPACLSDGNQPEWLRLDSMFDNEEVS